MNADSKLTIRNVTFTAPVFTYKIQNIYTHTFLSYILIISVPLHTRIDVSEHYASFSCVFHHSLEKCLKVSKDSLTARPFAHAISIQRMAILRVVIQ